MRRTPCFFSRFTRQHNPAIEAVRQAAAGKVYDLLKNPWISDEEKCKIAQQTAECTGVRAPNRRNAFNKENLQSVTTQLGLEAGMLRRVHCGSRPLAGAVIAIEEKSEKMQPK